MLALLLLPVLLVPQAERAEGLASSILAAVESARAEAGAGPLEYRKDLERIARDRARRLADLPHARRLKEPVEARIGEAGIERYRASSVHVDLNRGYHDPAAAFVDSWRATGWDKVTAPRFDAIGLATERGADGWIILVAILLEREPIRAETTLREMERQTLEAVNRVRREQGLGELSPDRTLTRLARAHSEDMVRRRYLDHVTPEGLDATDRVLRAAVQFRKVGENIHSSRGVDRPVEAAVASWLKSEGHRRNVLDAAFTETGIGLATDDEGLLVFTQLFLTP